MGNGVFATDLKLCRFICIGATKIHIGATAWMADTEEREALIKGDIPGKAEAMADRAPLSMWLPRGTAGQGTRGWERMC